MGRGQFDAGVNGLRQNFDPIWSKLSDHLGLKFWVVAYRRFDCSRTLVIRPLHEDMCTMHTVYMYAKSFVLMTFLIILHFLLCSC